LSGGIDSSLIAAYASMEKSTIRAFTASFRNPDLDELAFAQSVAKNLGIELVTVSGDDITSEKFWNIIYHLDEPLGDPASVPTYLLSERLSKHVRVVLSGEGADEFFHGYPFYRYESLFASFRFLTPIARTLFENHLPKWELHASLPRSTVRIAKAFCASYDIGVGRWTSVFGDGFLKSLFRNGYAPFDDTYLKEIQDRVSGLVRRYGVIEGGLLIDTVQWLPANLLVKVDRMSMAHSVEVRAPFLDQEVVRCAVNIDRRSKHDWGEGKKHLRVLLKKNFPPPIADSISSRKKHGFEVPIVEWLRQELRGVAEELLQSENIKRTGVLDPGMVSALYQSLTIAKDSSRLRRHLWLVLVFEAWAKLHKESFGLQLGDRRSRTRIVVS
jgi:asparagine synthase (glutamine-hydrolysing)